MSDATLDDLNRHEQRKAATHQRLIDAARDVITARGYNNVEILHITEHANVSKATFYKHFANKEDCARAVMQQGFDALVAQIMAAHEHTPDSGEWVRSSVASAFAWAAENREFMLIMVGGAASTQLNVFGRNYMVEVIERTIITNRLPALPTRYSAAVTAQVITGILIQLLGWWLEQPTGYTARQMGELVEDVVRHGIALPD